MTLTIDEFRGRATSEQNKIIDDLLTLSRREKVLAESVNREHAPYRKAAERERMKWGFHFAEIADLVIDREIAPAGYRAAAPYQQLLDEVRGQMKQIFVEAVQQGLGDLGIIQRHYQSYVGEPISTRYLR